MIEINVISPSDDSIPDMEQPEADTELDIVFLHEEYPEPSTTESIQSTDLESMIEINLISPSDDSIPDMEQPEADTELDISFLHEEYPEPSTTESIQSTDLESMIEINVISPSDDSIPDMEQPEADTELDISFLHEEYPEPSTTESLQSTDLESMIEINVISPSDDSIPDMEQPEADTELDISFLHEVYPEPSTRESLQSTDLESMIEINVISPSDDSIPDMEQPEADTELDISFLHEEYQEPSTTESIQSTDLESMIEINVISPSDDSIPDMEQPEADTELDISFLHEEYPEPSTRESLQSTDLESMIEINVISPSDDSIPDMEQLEADTELDISFLHEVYPEPSTTESLQSTDLESMIEINVISPSDDSIPDMEQPEADTELDISFLHEENPEPSTTESLQSMIEINVISPSDDSIPDMEQPEADTELDISFLHEEYPEPSTTESLQSTDLESMIEINVISPSDDGIPDMEQPEDDTELDISFLHEEYPEPSTTESIQSTDLESMIEINVISPSDDSIPDMEQPEADTELDISFLHEEYPEPSTTESLQSTDLESMIEINVISPSDDGIPDMEQPEADTELDISFLHEEYPEPSTTESIQSTDLESVIDINVISPSDNSISDTEHSEADIELVLSMRYLENLEPSTTESLQSTDLESMIEINVISPSDDSIPDMEQPEADTELDISFLHEEYPEPSTTESLQSTDLESMIEINVISPSDDSIPDMEQPEADTELDISFLHEEYPEPSTTESIQSTDLESVIDINVISPSDNSISDTEHSEADIELVLSMRYLENLEPSTTESLQSTDLESMIEINVISPSDDSIPDMEQPEADTELDISFLHEEYPEPSTTESIQSTDLESMIEINVTSPSDDSIPDMEQPEADTELDISFLHEKYPEPSTTESLQSTDLESMIEINVTSPSDDSIPDMEQPEDDTELDISFFHEEYPEPSTTESLQSTDLESMIEINVTSPSDDSIPDMEQPEADTELDISFLHEEYPEPSTTESLQSTDLELMIEINVTSPSDDSIPDMEQPEADTEIDISFLHEEYPEPSTTESLQSTDLESMIEINVISPSDDSIPDMEQPEADPELDILFLHEEYPEPSTTESLQSTDLESMIEINVISPSDDSIPDMEQPEADPELDISFLHEEYPEPSTTESLQSTDLESMIEINVISPSDDSIPDMEQPEADPELDISFLHEEYPEPSTTESLQSTDLESMIEINVISRSDDSIPDMEQPEADTELDISFLHEEYPEPSTTESLQSTDLESMIEINVISPSDDSIPDMEQPEADPELDISFLHEEYPEPSTTESLQSTDLESMIEINVISPSDDSIPDMEQPEADPELDISFLHEEYPEPSTTESLQSTDLESMIEINVISPSDDSIPDMEQPEADPELDIWLLHEEYPEPSTTESLQSTDLESMIEINVISPSDDSIPDMEQPEADPELDISFLHEEYPEPSTTESLQSTDLESMIEINVISPSDDSIPDMEQPEADPELDISFLHEEYPEPSTTESLQSTDLESMIEINVISTSDDSIPDMEQPEADPELDISFLHEEYPEPSTTESLQSTDLESMIEINVISPSDDSIPDMEQPEADPELDISFLHEEYPEPSTTESPVYRPRVDDRN